MSSSIQRRLVEAPQEPVRAGAEAHREAVSGYRPLGDECPAVCGGGTEQYVVISDANRRDSRSEAVMPSGWTSPPTLLMVYPLLEPLDRGVERIRRAAEIEVSSDEDGDLIRQGLFVLVVATLETALSDTLAYYLRSLPQKLPNAVKVEVDRLVTGEGLTAAVEDVVMRAAYKTWPEYVAEVCKYLSIEPDLTSVKDEVQEMKETRNLLLHNALVVNAVYLKKAGSKARATRTGPGQSLSIDAEYVDHCVDVSLRFLRAVRRALAKKYCEYTRAAAFRRLWDWIYDKGSPVCEFDDYWEVSDDGRGIRLPNELPRREVAMSSSERAFLWYFRMHYNDDGRMYLMAYDTDEPLRSPRLSCLDEVSRMKFSHLTRVLHGLWLSAGVYPHDPIELEDPE